MYKSEWGKKKNLNNLLFWICLAPSEVYIFHMKMLRSSKQRLKKVWGSLSLILKHAFWKSKFNLWLCVGLEIPAVLVSPFWSALCRGHNLTHNTLCTPSRDGPTLRTSHDLNTQQTAGQDYHNDVLMRSGDVIWCRAETRSHRLLSLHNADFAFLCGVKRESGKYSITSCFLRFPSVLPAGVRY